MKHIIECVSLLMVGVGNMRVFWFLYFLYQCFFYKAENQRKHTYICVLTIKSHNNYTKGTEKMWTHEVERNCKETTRRKVFQQNSERWSVHQAVCGWVWLWISIAICGWKKSQFRVLLFIMASMLYRK